MIDTHAHLNFSRFKKNVDEVIKNSRAAGIKKFIVPGTDITSSKKAVALAQAHDDIWAAVGIHPHHVYKYVQKEGGTAFEEEFNELEVLAQHERVVAIGEIGLDRHVYEDTKYGSYAISDEFIELQRTLFVGQIELAKRAGKSVIIHNREAVEDTLPLLEEHWDERFEHRMVFHCCEPREDLLKWAQEHKIFIGVDGDVTYWKEKQEFIKKVPLDMLVLETDSPFLLPEPMKSQKLYPNTPANLPYIAEFVANLRGESPSELIERTTENASKLFLLH